MAEDASISALLAEHGTWLMAFLRGLAGTAADADDAFQETWMRFIRLGGAIPVRGVRAYLVKTARSVVVDRLRRLRPAESLDAVGEDGASLVDELEDPSPGPGERYESRATAAEVREAIAALPLNWRQVVMMRVEGELEFREIAEELGVPLGTALAWMNRATVELKRKLGGCR